MDNKKWYAVICNNDADWGEGSNDLSTALTRGKQRKIFAIIWMNWKKLVRSLGRISAKQ